MGIAVIPLLHVRFYYSQLFVLKVKLYFIQAVGLLCLCASLWVRGKLRVPESPLNYPIACLLAVALVSAFVSTDASLSFHALISLFSFAVIYCVVSTEVRSSREVMVLLGAIAAIAAVVSLYSILQLAGVDSMAMGAKVRGRAATFSNYNFLGGYLASALAIVVAGVALVKSKRTRYVLLSMAALTVAGLVCSTARSAWVGFAAALAFFVFMKRPLPARNRSRVPVLLALLSVVVMASAISLVKPVWLVERFASVAGFKMGTVKHRFVTWRTSLDIVQSRPILGFGFGTFERVYPGRQAPYIKEATIDYGHARAAHNDYLETAADCGLLGLASLLWLMATAFTHGIRRMRSDAAASPVILMGLSCVTALSVTALFHNTLYTPTTGLFFWVSLALINYSPGIRSEERPVRAMVLKRSPAVILLIAVGYFIAVPFLSDYYFARGSTCLFENENREAISYFRRSLDLDRHQTLAHANIALIYMRLGRYRESREELEKAIGIEPNNATLHHLLGTLFEEMDLLDDALIQYEAALALEPRSKENYGRMGHIHSHRGEHGKAIECYLLGLEIEPGNHNLANDLGVTYARVGRYEEAIAAFRRAIRIKPGEACYRRNLAMALGDAGMHGRAIREYEKALELKADDAEIMIAAGREYARMEDVNGALRMYRSAIRTDPGNVRAHRYAAFASFRMGYYDESRREWSEVLKQDPGDSAAISALDKLRRMGFE